MSQSNRIRVLIHKDIAQATDTPDLVRGLVGRRYEINEDETQGPEIVTKLWDTIVTDNALYRGIQSEPTVVEKDRETPLGPASDTYVIFTLLIDRLNFSSDSAEKVQQFKDLKTIVEQVSQARGSDWKARLFVVSDEANLYMPLPEVVEGDFV